MPQKQYNFTIIFEELDKLSKDPTSQIIKEEIKEYEEIQTLREIVLEIQTQPKTYFSST
ncbi:MAG: hypothetical protein SCARUB_04644 [Candidatus Scalindua rubra]|uniref:Uncharacterized protein n=1 Tax=Candidatus Scalindua rubra TaxID=1872076 RepID=A0A1E3X3M0_9BACT|nr:MAG: hypothetical protein SCARUB_04644 [Candidatus Scalindua rubra]